MIGRSLKHYQVDAKLGQGGMGVVYRATDTRLDRPVAMKILSAELTGDADRRRRFFQEARAASKVNHPAIAQIYDVDETDGVTFIAMELIEGSTLRQLIQARELDVLGAIEVACQVGEGLAKAHEAGIVHRDIKSDNIMVTRDGHAKLLDFGLAKLHEPQGGGEDAGEDPSVMETMARTRVGVVLGTVAYMSPEQARGQGVDLRSDLFSLGVVLYEMVTGQLPFAKSSPIDTMYAIAHEETRPVTAIRDDLPPSLQRVISRALRKRPDDRYPSARAMVDDLQVVRRELESGISAQVPLAERIRDGLASLKTLTAAELAWPIAGAVILVLVLLLLFTGRGQSLGGLITMALIGLVVYRRLRNRRRRLLRRFVAKVRKMPEVMVVTLQGDQLTVVAEKAAAKTYLRVNALIDAINGKLFFGHPFTAAVLDGLDEDELRVLLQSPGVLHVREELL